MKTLTETQYWPLGRLQEAIDLLYPSQLQPSAQPTRQWLRTESDAQSGSQAPQIADRRSGAFAAAEAALQFACDRHHIAPVALSSEYAKLGECFSGAAPLIIPIRDGNSALVILRAGTNRVTVLATDGRRQHLPLDQVLSELRSPLPPELAQSIDLLRNRLGERHRRHR